MHIYTSPILTSNTTSHQQNCMYDYNRYKLHRYWLMHTLQNLLHMCMKFTIISLRKWVDINMYSTSSTYYLNTCRVDRLQLHGILAHNMIQISIQFSQTCVLTKLLLTAWFLMGKSWTHSLIVLFTVKLRKFSSLCDIENSLLPENLTFFHELNDFPLIRYTLNLPDNLAWLNTYVAT